MGVRKPERAKFPADGVAVLHRQHDIEDHDVVLVDGGLVERLFAVAGDIDGIGLFAEAFGDKSGDPGFVFNQQDAHVERLLPLCASGHERTMKGAQWGGRPQSAARPWSRS